MTLIYGITAFAAIALLVFNLGLEKIKEFWLKVLFGCVAIANVGYFLLSMSKTLEFALLANKIVYLGAVFLSLCMLMTIIKLCGFNCKRGVIVLLVAIGAVMFGIICTTGILPWYYKEVSLVIVDGAAKLSKVYGVLHPLYLVYLLFFFSAMVVVIIHSLKKKMIASQKQAVFLAGVVFGNIAVWFVEKFISWEFEFLSITYLLSECALLWLYWMMQTEVGAVTTVADGSVEEQGDREEFVDWEMLEEKIQNALMHIKEGEYLIPREREVLGLILRNKKRKEIAEQLHLSENTIKTYIRTLYNKLGISSREDLKRIAKMDVEAEGDSKEE